MKNVFQSIQAYQLKRPGPKRLGPTTTVITIQRDPSKKKLNQIRRSGGSVYISNPLVPPPIKKVQIRKDTRRNLNANNQSDSQYMIGIPTINGLSYPEQIRLGLLPSYSGLNKEKIDKHPRLRQLYNDASNFLEDPIVAPQDLPTERNYNRLLYNAYVDAGQFRDMKLKNPAEIFGFGSKKTNLSTKGSWPL